MNRFLSSETADLRKTSAVAGRCTATGPSHPKVPRWTAKVVLATVSTTLLSTLLLACGGPGFDGHVFRDGNVAFRLQSVPSGWRPLEISDTALAFRDEKNAATVAINGRCGQDAGDVPLKALTQHLFLQFTQREQYSQALLALDGREALRTRMVAKLDGVPKFFDVVVLKKNGCVYDFLQIANASQDPEPFLRFVRGFSSIS